VIFCNEVLEYPRSLAESEPRFAIACSFNEISLSLSPSLSRIRTTIRKKIIDSHDFDVGGKFAKSNFNSGTTAEIRFDIRRRIVRNESTNYPGKPVTSRGSLSPTLPSPCRANPDYSVNDAIRRIISVRIVRFLRSGELDSVVSLVLAISPRSRKNASDPLSGLVSFPVHRSL